MKKLVLPLFSMLLLAACGGQAASNGSETAGGDSTEVTTDSAKATDSSAAVNFEMSKAGAVAFVEAVYNNYFHPSKEDEDKIDNAELTMFGMAYMDKYMSDNLMQKIVEANDKQIVDDNLFLDYDIWINAQDAVDLTLKKVNSIEYTEGKATVEVVFTNGGEECKSYVIVEYNKDKSSWFVCDFMYPNQGSKKLTRLIDDFLDGDDL